MAPTMSNRKKIYEGKAKILYEGPEQGTLVQYFKDDATAFNAQKHDVIDGKGVLNNQISEYLFESLHSINIPTHFIRRLNMREQLVQRAEIIPLEVVTRNVAAGTLAKRVGVKEGTKLESPIIEMYLKDDELGDPLVTVEHIASFGWSNPIEYDEMVAYSMRINDFLSGLFYGVGIKLVDFKLEFGRIIEDDNIKVILADEISPDSCRLWDLKTNKKLDKDRFRQDLGETYEAYLEIAQRLGIINDNVQTSSKGPVLVE